MKKRTVAAFLVAAAAFFSGCSGSQDSSGTAPELNSVSSGEMTNASDDVPEKTIEEIENEVSEINLKAAGLKNKIDSWIVSCDTKGAYYTSGEYSEIEIIVKDGVWKASVSNPQAFKVSTLGQVLKNGASEGTKAGNHRETDNFTELLEIELANANTDIDDAYIFCAIYSARCKSLYFANGSDAPVPELNANIGDQAEWIDSTYAWGGTTSGVLSDGTIVGTAPNI